MNITRKETQMIGGIEVPAKIGLYMLYPHDDRRDDGTDHDSQRILVRVRPKKRQIEFVGANGRAGVRTEIVNLPQLSVNNHRKSVRALRQFNKETEAALDACTGALVRVAGGSPEAQLIGSSAYA